MATWWTKDKIKKAKKVLSESTSVSLALLKLEKVLKKKITKDSLRNALKRHGQRGDLESYIKSEIDPDSPPHVNKLLDFISKGTKSLSLGEICDYMDLSPKRVNKIIEEARVLGYRVETLNDKEVYLDKKPRVQDKVKSLPLSREGKNRIRFAAISDTHIGAKAAMKEEIQHFVNEAYDKYNVRTIVHGGDCLAGNGVYRGQEVELERWGCQDQCELFAEVLPKREGLNYIAITGNHDIDFVKKNGADPAFTISKLRDDFTFIGDLKAKFLVEGTELEVEVAHISSTAHARSYSLEKHIYRTISQTNMPDVVLCGHRHVAGFFEVQGIQCFMLPCFEDANFFVKYKDFYPSAGGTIIDIVLNEYNQIIECIPRFKYYSPRAEKVKTFKV